MALPLFKEKRFSPRRRLTGLLPGKLVRGEEGYVLDCKVIDVSEHGIGIILNYQLAQDEVLYLIIGELKVALAIAWNQPGFGKRNQVRYGLVAQDQQLNLENLFSEKGCLV